jgi:dihydrodiol dehydrogenase / D-xylose 1-dehydrogenase (NADP)
MPIRWGFIGSGRIIPSFIEGLAQVEDAVPAAIYARNKAKAQALADRYGIAQVFDDIDEFASKAEIDAAYVAVTHPHHMEFTLKCLSAKIPTLCEKPMAPNKKQVLRMIECAKKNDTFLAEAFWTRMFPVTQQVKQWVSEGRIGKVTAMNSIFSFRAVDRDGDRLFEPSEAGGTLLDIGVYQIQAAYLIFGRPPKEIVSLSAMNRHGTDETAGYVFKYDNGEIATMLSSFRSNGRNVLSIYGTEGMIEVFDDFHMPRNARLICSGGTIEFRCPEANDPFSIYKADAYFKSKGYQFEIAHINDCVKKGLKESPLIPLSESLDIITTCDAIRGQWGLVYPFEKK